MLAQFLKKLEHAEGRSEFVISVICDIRGFSAFSTCHESPDTAMFIKRFYATLLERYFTQAVFAKPTGDGLLLIFRYTEENLHAISRNVLSMCFKLLKDFPALFRDDPMINFATPSRVGFGISRGPSCCLFSGRTILDYSGQLLNLAARLNDFARPQGIVIAGSYLLDVIPKNLQSRFRTEHVYVRGIAEQAPVEVFCSEPDVVIPTHALHPLVDDDWVLVTTKLTVGALKKLMGTFTLDLPSEPASNDKTRMSIRWDNPKFPGYWVGRDYKHYDCFKASAGQHVKFDLKPAKKIAAKEKFGNNTELNFRFEFIPRAKNKAGVRSAE